MGFKRFYGLETPQRPHCHELAVYAADPYQLAVDPRTIGCVHTNVQSTVWTRVYFSCFPVVFLPSNPLLRR